jgi:hypothetical protein
MKKKWLHLGFSIKKEGEIFTRKNGFMSYIQIVRRFYLLGSGLISSTCKIVNFTGIAGLEADEPQRYDHYDP